MSRFILSAVQEKKSVLLPAAPSSHEDATEAALHVWFEFSVGALPDITSPSPTKQDLLLEQFQTTDVLGSLMCWWFSSEHCSLKHCCIFSRAQLTKGCSHCDSVTGLLLWCGWDPNGSVALPSFRGRSHHLLLPVMCRTASVCWADTIYYSQITCAKTNLGLGPGLDSGKSCKVIKIKIRDKTF